MNLVATVLLAATCVTADDTKVLFFTSDQCPACENVKPAVKHLVAKGYPISQINISESPSWADRYQVSRVPTFVLIRSGQELNRHVGQLSAVDLANMIRNAPQSTAPKSSASDRPSQRQRANNGASQTPLRDVVPSAENNFVSTKSNNVNTYSPQERAHQASVRLRIIDEDGTNHGSGTIIHVHDNEALVLTCGHIFRESNGKGQVSADIGFPSDHKTVSGKLLSWDGDAHDIALVVINVDENIEPVPIAQKRKPVMPGDKLFSFGCNRGEDPSLREGKLLRIPVYSGVNKYDVSNRPIDGRSGGGLFAADGTLVGVCNAADVNHDEGIYAGLDSVYWILENAGLEEIFDAPKVRVAEKDNQAALQKGRQLRQSTPEVTKTSTQVTDGRSRTNDDLVPITRVSNNVSNQPTSGGDVEMIVIVRSRSNPGQSNTFVIDEPSGDLLRQVAAEKLRNQNGARDSHQARRGPIAPPRRFADSEMRAQSPH